MGDPGFKFDFEHSLPAMAAPSAPTDLPPAMRKNYRQVHRLYAPSRIGFKHAFTHVMQI